MREQQPQQSTETNTEQMAESTMNQSQQAMEQLIDLQRNVARMTLSALKWQETAQQQGLEMTKSMLENAPGPQFTESMMQSYLQGMEAVMPEMEQVMERGMQAAAQPQMEQVGLMEDRMRNQPSGQGQRGTSGHTGGQQLGGQRTEHRQTGGGMRSQQGMGRQRQMQTPAQMGGQQGQSGRSQPHPSQQYSQTGEWVTPQEYGGESTGASGYQQQPMTASPTHSSGPGSEQFGGQSQRGQFEQGHQAERQSQSQGSRPRTEGQQGPGQHGSQPRSSDRTQRGREYDQPTQPQQSSPGQTEQGRLREQYSQRIDTDRREGGERGRQGRGEQSPMRGRPSQRSEADTGRDEPTRSPERRAMEETDVTSEQPQRPTKERRGNEERGPNQE